MLYAFVYEFRFGDHEKAVFGERMAKNLKDNVEKSISEMVPFARKGFANEVDVRIMQVIQDDFIIELRQFIARDILGQQPTGLEKFMGCRDTCEAANDPFLQILIAQVQVHPIYSTVTYFYCLSIYS